MRRRDFLATSVAMAQVLAARAVLGQGAGPAVRAAVVIGVDKSGDLPVLSAAASGARQVADWLKAEGFEVLEFLDDQQPVRVGEIFNAVAELIDRGTLDQLLVYFSGHGFLNNYSEHWMLSDAPRNPNEAISLIESVVLARESAIPNVIFISDACRSTAGSLGIQRVHGSLIFPILPVSRSIRSEIDQFLATLPGDPALEVPVGDSVADFEGIYTASFLEAFEHPDDDMVWTTLNGVRVVPNRRLKGYLLREVQKKAEAKSIKLRQIPDAIIESGETIYIGRVANPPLLSSGPTPSREATIRDVAGLELERAGAGSLLEQRPPVPEAAAEVDRLAVALGFTTARDTILEAQNSSQFETETGFAVSGTSVTLALARPEMEAEIQSEGDGLQQPTIIQLRPVPGSLILRFADGSGTVIPSLPEYVGAVVVNDAGVVNVSYIPSQSSWRWGIYLEVRERLDQLRAVVATAARLGVFRIEGEREIRAQRAAQLADSIRMLKSIDPTLGVYAAYAYAEADFIDQARSVLGFMRDDLGTDLFDVAMLAGELSESRSNQRLIPFCPMLYQGWGLLRVRNVQLPPELEKARDHLRPALWTTFDPDGMSIIIRAFREGQL